MIFTKAAYTLLPLLLATWAQQVEAHGALTLPKPRFGKTFDNDDHIRQPIHLRVNLFPAGTSMTPCGGLKKADSKVAATPVKPGQDLAVEWEMG
jgi:hypothetical protein